MQVVNKESDRSPTDSGNQAKKTGRLGGLREAFGSALFSRAESGAAREEILYRIPLAVAMVSVAFENFIWRPDDWSFAGAEKYLLTDGLYCGLIFCSAVLCLFAKSSRIGVALYTGLVAITMLPGWMLWANHNWLAMWAIPMAIIFRQWWRSDLYSLYLRVTLGIVMLAAFSQKILAGTYVDGTYIYFLSGHGSTTERLFSFACDMSAGVPCLAHKLISQFILVWQLAVGLLLLSGVKSLLFLTIEIGFLLGAGLFADEMNFQVLNIALLCIVFQVGMPIWLLVICLVLLVLDLFGLGHIYEEIVLYVW